MSGRKLKMEDAHELGLPPGFRFHPTDEELVIHYLCRRCAGQPISVPIIAEIDLYKFNPWELPDMAHYGEKEWYFFSPRDRKYPNGSRPNRAAGSGYWKATGADKPIGRPRTLAIKKALVFYSGKANNKIKTNWIMHEYRLADVDRSAGNNKNQRLDEWVLCHLYNKKGVIEKHYSMDEEKITKYPEAEDVKPNVLMSGPIGIGSYTTSISTNGSDNIRQSETYDEDSSSSEHMLSTDGGVNDSEPKWSDVGFGFDFDFDFELGSDHSYDAPVQFQMDVDQMQDVFAYLQETF